MRWMLDARHRREAADMTRDHSVAAAAIAEIALLEQRCVPTRSDEQSPAEWEDWPDYPPQEHRP